MDLICANTLVWFKFLPYSLYFPHLTYNCFAIIVIPMLLIRLDANVLQQLWSRLNPEYDRGLYINQPFGLLNLIARKDQIQSMAKSFGLSKQDVLISYGRMVSMWPLQKILDGDKFQFIKILNNAHLYDTSKMKYPKLFESMDLFFEDFYKPKIEEVYGLVKSNVYLFFLP